MTAEPRHLLVEVPIRVKTYDIDFVGHVNNIVYVRWLEDLRLLLLDTYFPIEPMRQSGIVPIIVNSHLDYHVGIKLADHEVLGRMWIKKFGKATFYLDAEFIVRGTLCCTAWQRGAFVDAKTLRPVRVPEGLAKQHPGPRE
ncbi:MAG: thioesterase family protein [Chloroflexi bacterium]|nr:thioesterase family protein [Chloroflexota bacterium]